MNVIRFEEQSWPNTNTNIILWQCFLCRFKNRLGKNSHLRCFVANFISNGLTRFFVLIFLDKKCARANFYTFCMSDLMQCWNRRPWDSWKIQWHWQLEIMVEVPPLRWWWLGRYLRGLGVLMEVVLENCWSEKEWCLLTFHLWRCFTLIDFQGTATTRNNMAPTSSTVPMPIVFPMEAFLQKISPQSRFLVMGQLFDVVLAGYRPYCVDSGFPPSSPPRSFSSPSRLISFSSPSYICRS